MNSATCPVMWPAQSEDFMNIHPVTYMHVLAPCDVIDLESCGNVVVFVDVVRSSQTVATWRRSV